jgi:hypothetical protein
MDKMDLQAVYIERLNALLPTLDFKELDRSCNIQDNMYAKEALKKMHDLFIEVYGTDDLDYGDYEFVDVPAVILGRNTGHMGLGIVTLDLQSSGEHCGTFFLTPKGIIDQGFDEMKPADIKYLADVYVPYNYWYTVYIQRDHHVDFDHVPQKVAEMLEACQPGQREQMTQEASEQQGNAQTADSEQADAYESPSMEM